MGEDGLHDGIAENAVTAGAMGGFLVGLVASFAFPKHPVPHFYGPEVIGGSFFVGVSFVAGRWSGGSRFCSMPTLTYLALSKADPSLAPFLSNLAPPVTPAMVPSALGAKPSGSGSSNGPSQWFSRWRSLQDRPRQPHGPRQAPAACLPTVLSAPRPQFSPTKGNVVGSGTVSLDSPSVAPVVISGMANYQVTGNGSLSFDRPGRAPWALAATGTAIRRRSPAISQSRSMFETESLISNRPASPRWHIHDCHQRKPRFRVAVRPRLRTFLGRRPLW